MPSYDMELALQAEGYRKICGVDEAGRGPLCGSVVAAACILPEGLYIPELNDSKKLTPKKREKLYETICSSAVAYGIAEATVEEITRINLLCFAFFPAPLISLYTRPERRPAAPVFTMQSREAMRGFADTRKT